MEYLFMRHNPKGFVRERWLHVLGCRQWFIVVRSTITHEIRAAVRFGNLLPEVNP